MQISLMQNGNSNFSKFALHNMDALVNVIKSQTYCLGYFNKDHRTNSNFKAAQFVGLDFDNGMTLKQAVEAFKDYTHIIGTTRNHNKDKGGLVAERFRVILKLDKEVTTAADYKATVLALLKEFPSADKQCSDAARMFFPCINIVSTNFNGKLVSALKYEPKVSNIDPIDTALKGNLSKNTLSFIALGAKSGEWNGSLFKAAVDCNEQGYSEEEAIKLLTPASLHYEGELNDEDLKTISSAYNRDPKHPPRLPETCFMFKKPKDINPTNQKPEWLTDGLLGADAMSLLVGVAKSGKSTISRQLAHSVANGLQIFNRQCKKGTVLYLALEESEYLIKDQFKKIGVKDDDNIFIHVGPFSGGDVIDSLRLAIQQHDAKLLVIDTLILLAMFDNLNDYNEVYGKMSKFRNLARETKCHIMCLHHQNKGEDRGTRSVLGSGALIASVDCTIVFNMINGRNGYRKISSTQRGGLPLNDLELQYVPDNDIYIISPNQDNGGF